MKKETYNFEIKDLLTQFVAAFDDTVIKRFNRNRSERQKVEVRYVFAPKQRVMYDLINKAQHITLPVVTVDLTSVSYDKSRSFNKLDKLYNYQTEVNNTNIEMPTPVNLQVTMSIIGRYMHDVEQIITNFAPFTNPYIIITWREPTEIEGEDVEIRTEVLWDEQISLNSPTETTYNDKFRVVADTSFTIKGWLFRNKNNKTKPIYFIDNNFIQVSKDWNLTSALSGLDYEDFFESINNSEVKDQYVDNISLSAIPEIDNIYLTTGGSTIEATYNSPVKINREVSGQDVHNYTLLGNNYTETTEVLLSSDNATLTSNLTTFDTKYTGTITGFLLPSDNYTVMNNNTMSVNLPPLNGPGNFNIIVKNPAGWTSTSSISGFYMIAE